MRSDSFAGSGEALARISTYRAANGCNTAVKPPASARLTMMMENSPRASSVNEVLSEPMVDPPFGGRRRAVLRHVATLRRVRP
jgi:hypothetical protein